ncbi:MAG: hypothetical protein K8I27_08605 [Planctomycetes bacterium]|nr:hypothetical protein [Planctomycetota bacterium]
MKRSIKIIIAVVALVGGLVGVAYFANLVGYETYERERTDVDHSSPRDLLNDDRLEDKQPAFNPQLIDSRLISDGENQWQLNASAAVTALDVRDTRSDEHEAMHRLYPSYAEAATALEGAGYDVLPSVNLIGGKAKQFDDGLYAALDAYMAQNAEEGVRDIELCVRAILTELNPKGEAYAWLYASLEVGRMLSPDEHSRLPEQVSLFARGFLASPEAQPVGFYTWNENLARVFQFLRYLQHGFPVREGAPNVLANALRRNSQAREQYARMLEFYGRLTNPFIGLSLLDISEEDYAGSTLAEIAKVKDVRRAVVSFLPYSDSKEVALFERLYPLGVPANAELMRDLIKAIRDGKIDLSPDANSGWYDYQLHALETLLLPEKAPENEKLLLTKKYKQRLLEAFKSMITKTRETHIRQSAGAVGSAAEPPQAAIKPRLRIEPNPTYYLRIARSYAFVQRLVQTMIEQPDRITGWTGDGPRKRPLGEELNYMRMLFYGLYFISCEDIGFAPQLKDGELNELEPEYTQGIASEWLKDWVNDPDLARDTRVAVPIYRLPGEYTRFWCTMGVRPIRLAASYARKPSWRPLPADGDEPKEWEEIPGHQTEVLDCVILGDEFAEIEMRGDAVLTRQELRDICDNHKSKEEIVSALQR